MSGDLLELFVRAAFVENLALSLFLGMCFFLAISQDVGTARGFGAAEIYQNTLESTETVDPTEQARQLTDLRTLQEWVITPLLKSVPGVNEINSFGGYFKEYQIIVKPEKLLAYDITLDDVYRAAEENNQNVGGNVLERYAEQYIVCGVGLVKSEDDSPEHCLAIRQRDTCLCA